MQTICEVDLAAIRSNLEFLLRLNPSSRVIPVVKANAYGHGAIAVVETLRDHPAVERFAVATLEEAQDLAREFPELPLLVLSRVFPAEMGQIPENTQLTISSMEDLEALKDCGISSFGVQLNINTGMNRLGVTPSEAVQIARGKFGKLDIAGIYSHFSSSDARNETVYHQQAREMQEVYERLRQSGWEGCFHIANSAACLKSDLPEYQAIRVGISLYGYDPREGSPFEQDLIPAMRVRAPLVRIVQIGGSETVSYGERWTATGPTRIGTLRIGYADGYNRALTNRGYVCAAGKAYPVTGTVTMDHIMVNLVEDELATGSYLTVLGEDCPATRVQHVAQLLGTIPYEITCAISPRVQRRYLNS